MEAMDAGPHLTERATLAAITQDKMLVLSAFARFHIAGDHRVSSRQNQIA
jgi:hypothetical protein